MNVRSEDRTAIKAFERSAAFEKYAHLTDVLNFDSRSLIDGKRRGERHNVTRTSSYGVSSLAITQSIGINATVIDRTAPEASGDSMVHVLIQCICNGEDTK